MNESDPASAENFFCFVQDKVEGPFDLIELAGQLKYANIEADTPVCREGSEDWFPFSDLPEFIVAQGMPVEVIARHLEEKERTELLSKSPKKPASFPWIFITIAMFLLGLVGVALFSPRVSSSALQKPTETVVYDAWVTRDYNTFSVQCPVLLERGTSQQLTVIHYVGHISGFGFGFGVVQVGIAGTHPNDVTTQLIDSTRDQFLNGLGAKYISDRNIPNPDYQCREITFSTITKGIPGSGRMRIITTQNYFFLVFAVTGQGVFGNAVMDRFLNSFKPH